MNAADHDNKAELIDQQQQALDRSTAWFLIIDGCHVAAQHYCWAAFDWAGANHHAVSQNHRHGQIPGLLQQAQAPAAVRDAWIELEKLRTRATYGTGMNGVNADAARTLLTAIRSWAVGLRP